MGKYGDCFEEENIRKAIRTVMGSVGSKTPGPDGITRYSGKYVGMEKCVREVKERLRRRKKTRSRVVEIPKSNGKTRKITICNLYDRMAQEAVYRVIRTELENHMNKNSYGFRMGISAKIPISKIANKLSESNQIFSIGLDFEKCFDNIPLDSALNCLRDMGINDGKLIRTIKHLMYVSADYNGIGISQGTILGPILCNCYLTKLDNYIEGSFITGRGRTLGNNMFYPKHKHHWVEWCLTGRRKNRGISIDYYRYADDTIILCYYEEEVEYVIDTVSKWIKENLEININEAKTEIGKNEVTFLGYSMKKDKYTKRAWLRMKDAKKFTDEMCKYRIVGQREAIEFVTKLRGVFRYFDMANDLGYVLRKIDWHLFIRSLGKHGLIRREGELTGYRGHGVTIDPYGLRKLTKCSFKDYLMGNSWITKREFLSDLFSNEWNDNAYELWTMQKGKDKCTKKDLNLDSVEIHHVIPRGNGGSNDISNLIMVSKETHKLIHSGCTKNKSILWYHGALLRAVNG